MWPNRENNFASLNWINRHSSILVVDTDLYEHGDEYIEKEDAHMLSEIHNYSTFYNCFPNR